MAKSKNTTGRTPECVGGQKPPFPPVSGARGSQNYGWMWPSRRSQRGCRNSPGRQLSSGWGSDLGVLISEGCPLPLDVTQALGTLGSKSSLARSQASPTSLLQGSSALDGGTDPGDRPRPQAAASLLQQPEPVCLSPTKSCATLVWRAPPGLPRRSGNELPPHLNFARGFKEAEVEVRKKTKYGPSNCGEDCPPPRRHQVYKQDTHPARGERAVPAEPRARGLSRGSQRRRGVLSGRPSGGPCRPGCKEAGWQDRAWLRLQPASRGRQAGLRAGLGRVAGTASGRVLPPSLAGGGWAGSPGRTARGSWAARWGAEGKGRAPQWWTWWWSRRGEVGNTSCTNSSRNR